MKPKNIFLIRHGQSEGNVDYNYYSHKQDYTLLLTELGKQQAIEAGKNLLNLIDEKSKSFFYVSPLWRTRMTFEGILEGLNFKRDYNWREEPRIREQEWGHLRDKEECDRVDKERNDFGSFYYRIPDGESCADVYDRMSDFFNTLHRDFQKEDFPENCIIITHGTSIRCFLMRWFHWTVEEFESVCNPKNCEIFQMKLNENNKYDLITELRKKDILPTISRPVIEPIKPDEINKPAFEVIRLRKTTTTKNTNVSLFKIENNIFKETIFYTDIDRLFSHYVSEHLRDPVNSKFYIDAVKRLSDNKIFISGDEIDRKEYYSENKWEYMKISKFMLDGEYYITHKLSSKSGIQAFVPGGTLIDLEELTKIE